MVGLCGLDLESHFDSIPLVRVRSDLLNTSDLNLNGDKCPNLFLEAYTKRVNAFLHEKIKWSLFRAITVVVRFSYTGY